MKIIEHNNKRYRVAHVATAQGTWLSYQGHVWLSKPAQKFRDSLKKDADVRAPMTGRIVKVEVKKGQEVKENDLLVVMEAMKMEYRLTAPNASTIEEVCCQEGELVDLGKTIVILTPNTL